MDIEFPEEITVDGDSSSKSLESPAVPSNVPQQRTPNPNSLVLPKEYGVRASQSRAFFAGDENPAPIEFFLSSDASAVIKHTKKVLFLEDDDIAHIYDGELHIHRSKRKLVLQ